MYCKIREMYSEESLARHPKYPGHRNAATQYEKFYLIVLEDGKVVECHVGKGLVELHQKGST